MENIVENFTQEPWRTAGEDGTFIYALRPSQSLFQSLSGKPVEENVFDLKINASHPNLRAGEVDANVQLILTAKLLYFALKELTSKMNKVVEIQNNRDGPDTYCGFTTAEFDIAREALKMATAKPGQESK